MPAIPKVTNSMVEEALKKCIDPELGIDIINLGLIYEIVISENNVSITMTLTTPGCPLVPYFRQNIIDHVKSDTQVETVDIILSFEPPWSPDMMSKEAKTQLTMLRS